MRRSRGNRCVRWLRPWLLLTAAGAGAQGSLDVTLRVVNDVHGLRAALIVIGTDAVETRAESGPERDTRAQ